MPTRTGLLAEATASEPGTLLLYWDYELQRGAEASRSGPNQWGIDDFHQTQRALDLLDEYQMKSTFAAVGYAALDGELPYHAPDQIKEIADRGHEVASHSWEHEWIPDLTYEELREVLRRSKAQLEDVTGRTVVSFAPPWNVPTKFMRKAAIGLYQRRRSRYDRIDIPTLCRALAEEGYETCRITYEPVPAVISRHLFKRIVSKPTRPEWVEGTLCFKVNGSGFADESIDVVRATAEQGGFAVIFAHPHSLIADNDQNIEFFTEFLEVVRELRDKGKLVVGTPGEVLRDRARAGD